MLCIKGLITDLTMYLPAGAIYKDKRIDFNKMVKLRVLSYSFHLGVISVLRGRSQISLLI